MKKVNCPLYVRPLYVRSTVLVIDCDTGVDDAFAIQFLLNHDDVEILAITT